MYDTFMGFPGGASSKEPGCQRRRHKRQGFDSWVGKIPWSRVWPTHSSILAWRIPWTEKPSGHGVTKSRIQLKRPCPRALHIYGLPR